MHPTHPVEEVCPSIETDDMLEPNLMTIVKYLGKKSDRISLYSSLSSEEPSTKRMSGFLNLIVKSGSMTAFHRCRSSANSVFKELYISIINESRDSFKDMMFFFAALTSSWLSFA